MPQFQMLEPAPNFGSQLGAQLGAGVSQGIGQSLNQFFEQKQKQEKTNRILAALNIPNPNQPKKAAGAGVGSASAEISSPKAAVNGFRLTPEGVAAVAFEDPALGAVFGSLLQAQEKGGEKEREFHYKRAGKVLEEADAARNALIDRRIALNTAKSAIDKDEVGFFSPANISQTLGQITGVDLPQDASGAQLSSAGKNFLTSTLARVGGGRPNQFIEQQIVKATPRIGQSKQANVAAYLPLAAGLDIEEKYLQAIDDLDRFYMEKQGFPPADLARQAQAQIRPWVEDRMKQLEVDLKENAKGPENPMQKRNFSTLDSISETHKPAKGDQAINKKTGEKFAWDGKEWKKVAK